jgi:1-acyl-sn-glycerol-3-phosphate acyltransferase
MIKLFFRSLAFNVLFFLWTTIVVITGLPALFGDRRYVHNAARRWGKVTNFLLEHVVGITVEFRGRDYLRGGPHLIACKHQSLWETAMIETLVPDCTIILKRELMWIPLFGQLLLFSDMIGINRKSGKKVFTQIVEGARDRLGKGRSVWIFPEGTRRNPGDPPQYKYGVYALYHALNRPIIPVALNSGYFWGRRSFIKKPGKIILEVLPPILPGLDARSFLNTLEQAIETASKRLTPHSDIKSDCKEGSKN